MSCLGETFLENNLYGTMAALSLILASIILMSHGQMAGSSIDLFRFIPMDAVDRVGMIMGAFVGVSALANLTIMNRYLSKQAKDASNSVSLRRMYSKLAALGRVIVDEVAIQKRFQTCTDRNRYWAHLLLVWASVACWLLQYSTI
jgi:hypothetical protein